MSHNISDNIIAVDFDGAVRVFPPTAPQEPSTIAIVDNEEYYEIRSALPGVEADDVFVGIAEDVLTIGAKTCTESERPLGGFFAIDHRVVMVEQSFALPADVDTSNLTAALHDGVLSIYLAKTPTSNVVPLFAR